MYSGIGVSLLREGRLCEEKLLGVFGAVAKRLCPHDFVFVVGRPCAASPHHTLVDSEFRVVIGFGVQGFRHRGARPT